MGSLLILKCCRLIQSLIILEHSVFPSAKPTVPVTPESSGGSASGEHLNYKPTVLIPKQQIFLSAILSALRNENMRNMHGKWLNMVASCLPYFGDNLKQISISVIHQVYIHPNCRHYVVVVTSNDCKRLNVVRVPKLVMGKLLVK